MQTMNQRPRSRTLTREQLDDLKEELQQELLRLTDTSFTSEGGTALLQVRSPARTRALLAALARIKEGTYGICQRCTTAISYLRLAAIPETMTCAACAQGHA